MCNKCTVSVYIYLFIYIVVVHTKINCYIKHNKKHLYSCYVFY